MISIEAFFDVLVDKVRLNSGQRITDTVAINIENDIPNNVDLSSLLKNAIWAANEDFDAWSNIRLELFIRGHFEYLEFDNDFPSKTSFIFAHGQYLRVKQSGMQKALTSEEPNEMSTFYFYNSSVSALHIHSSLKVFDSEHLSVDDFQIYNSTFDNIFFDDLEIHGAINKLAIRSVGAKRANIDIVNTVGSENTINVHFQYFNPKYFYFQARKEVIILVQIGVIPKMVIILHTNAKSVKIEEVECEHFDLEQRLGTIGILAFRRITGLKSITVTGHHDDDQTNRIEELYLNSLNLNKDFGGVIEYFKILEVTAIFNLINQGSIRFTDVDMLSSMVRISKSRLGNFTFINSKIPDKIFIDASNLEDIRFVGTISPTQFEAVEKGDSTLVLNNEIQVFQQMKTVMEKTGDKDLAKFFRYQELKLRSKRVRLRNPAELEEKFTLWLNSSNNHGQSWVKPAVIALLVSGPIIFTSFLRSIGYEIYFSRGAFDTFLSLWAHYFDVIIPSYLYPSKNKLAFLENFLGKEKNELWKLSITSQFLILANDVIIMPYLIIQTISAFRRHVT